MLRSFSLLLITASLGLLSACASNPHKAEEIETKMESAEKVADEKVGIKNGNMIVQKKVAMNEQLRLLQNEVYELEDRVYGNRKYGSKGLYGALRECRIKQTSKELGGDGKLMWTEPMDRVTDKEEEWTVGVDEEEKIVAVKEEFLKDRIERFQRYKGILQKRQDEYEEKLEICDAAVAAKKFDLKKAAEAKAASQNP